MPTITAVEVKEEKPDWQGKGATVYRYTVEGDERRPTDFVVKGNQPKAVGDSVEIEDSEYGPKVKKQARAAKPFGRSPADTKAIQRQHSQEMALRKEANMIAAGNAPFSPEQLRHAINWFEEDIKGKDRSVKSIGGSDVPVDLSDTPFDGPPHG